jgi:hypothetical protein
MVFCLSALFEADWFRYFLKIARTNLMVSVFPCVIFTRLIVFGTHPCVPSLLACRLGEGIFILVVRCACPTCAKAPAGKPGAPDHGECPLPKLNSIRV